MFDSNTLIITPDIPSIYLRPNQRLGALRAAAKADRVAAEGLLALALKNNNSLGVLVEVRKFPRLFNILVFLIFQKTNDY